MQWVTVDYRVLVLLSPWIFIFIWRISFQVESIRAVFKKELDIPIVEIADPKAKLDGGDVLFTGNIDSVRLLNLVQ